MWCKIKNFIGKYACMFPLIIVTIGIFYYINLFERLYSRDLNRQISEKSQILTLTESLANRNDVTKAILTLDTFEDSYTYLFKDVKNELGKESLEELYHSADCPFKLKQHPSTNEEINNLIATKKRGSFATYDQKPNKIIWQFRHFITNDEKLLVIAGISNYPQEPIDKELQISIGLLLFITGLLNWALVGYAKYIHSGVCKIKKEK